MSVRRRLAEMRVAFMMLTRLPVGRMTGEIPTLAASAWAFPLCGAVVGALAWAGYAAALSLGLSPGIAATLAVAVGAGVTGGLHEDGLADFADGIGGGQDRARKLEIMRDSRIGSYGVIALILALLLRVEGVAAAGGALAAFVAVGALGRAAVVLAMTLLPAARADGLGRSAGGAGAAPVAGAMVLALSLVALLGGVAVPVVLIGAAAGAAVSALALRQVGGQTGDVLGAVLSASEVAAWLTLAAIG